MVAQYSKMSAKGRYGNNNLFINEDSNAFRDKDHLEETLLHEIIHAYTVETLKEPKINLPPNVADSLNKIEILRRSLIFRAKSVDSEFTKKLLAVKSYRTKSGQQLSATEHVLAYGLESNEEFLTMAMTNQQFRTELDQLSNNFPQEGSLIQKLWNALLDFLGLNSLSQINKDYVANEIFQFINTIDDNLNPNVEKSKLKEGFRYNEKLRKVEEILNEIESLTDNIVENPKESITFAKNSFVIPSD